MVVYLASRTALPLIPWQQDRPAFNVSALTEPEQSVRRHFIPPHICQAGSHTGCGCGFNEGRQFPEYFSDPAAERVGALKSSSQLAGYIREHRVEQIYSCWSGEENEPKESERRIKPDELIAEDFFFRQRELLIIAHDGA